MRSLFYRIVTSTLLLVTVLPANATESLGGTTIYPSASLSGAFTSQSTVENGQPQSTTASTSAGSAILTEINADTQNVATYLLNLGAYMGFNLTKAPPSSQSAGKTELINLPTIMAAELYVFNTVLASIPVNVSSSVASSQDFVPTKISSSTYINPLANSTFTTYGSGQGAIAPSQLIDQQPYQEDPVSQSILNILGTPDFSYCLTNASPPAWTPGCSNLSQGGAPTMYQYEVAGNAIGPIPDPYKYFSATYNQKVVNQLNSNALIAPLLYTTTGESASTNSAGASPADTSSLDTIGGAAHRTQKGPLKAKNQAQEALNFIRYATGAVAPATLVQFSDYSKLYNNAMGLNNAPLVTQYQAMGLLANYIANLRVYAAQSSVGIGNLYYILSKRLPQNMGGSSGSGNNANSNAPSVTSEALSQFNMATWRLYNPDHSMNQQWINQINTASSSTVEKEIAMLLAEINYQLYLNRQQEERILLTNSMLLLQNVRANQPNAQTLGNAVQTLKQ